MIFIRLMLCAFCFFGLTRFALSDEHSSGPVCEPLELVVNVLKESKFLPLFKGEQVGADSPTTVEIWVNDTHTDTILVTFPTPQDKATPPETVCLAVRLGNVQVNRKGVERIFRNFAGVPASLTQ